MKWDKVRLLDLCHSISDGDHQAPPKSETGIPFVTIANIVSNQFDFSNTMFVPEGYYDRLDSKRKPQKGDILYSVVGSFGIPVLIKDNRKFVFQRHIAILRPNEDVVDSRYVYYSMLSRDFFCRADAAAIGAAQRTISLSSLRNLSIDLPPLPIQRRIADILSAYDDLIENNRRQIKLLEEAAQRLYKEWFVDLHFPGHEHTKIVDGVPEGWMSVSISDVCLKMNAGGTPNRRNSNYWGNAIKWYKTGELKDCWLIDSDEYLSEEGLNNSSAKLFPPNTILMAIYASPTLGRLGILASTAACNQAALCLIADEQKVSWQWLYMKLMEHRDEFNAIAKGAGQQNISADAVKTKIITLPPKNLVDKYTQIISDFFANMLVLEKKILELAEARDRLLPKLMSGEIGVVR